MSPSEPMRWVIAVAACLALVGLIAYVRGDDSDGGRSPEPEQSLVTPAAS